MDEQNGISLGHGIDLKTGDKIRVIHCISAAANSNFFIIKDDEIFTDYKNAITFGQQISNVTQLNENGSEITLVECIAQAGRFKLNNCYFGHAALVNKEFYNIDGDIYYKLSNNILVKCFPETNS